MLVPTRELAMQVHEALEPLGRGLSVRMKTVVGGTSLPKQVAALRRGVEVLVATPGRLLDLMDRGACALTDVAVTVVDEADLMSDMGFLPDITRILDQVPSGQRMLFSATLDGEVDTIVRMYLTDPVTHALAPPSASVDTMDHHLLMIAPKDKVSVAAEIANREGRTILFVRTKHAADRLAKQLNAVGVRAGALHGGKTQAVRTRTLAEFREGGIGALVATNVAARGIHVDNVSLVVHVDPPMDPKDYLHRAGRTARAGEAGTVATLVLPHQARSTSRMAQQAGVRPSRTRVAPGGADLTRLTGATPPGPGSAVPVRPGGGLRWVAPNLIHPEAEPERGRLIVWAASVARRPRVEVRQGGRLLWAKRLHRTLVPGRPYYLPAGWFAEVNPCAGPVEITAIRRSGEFSAREGSVRP